MRAGVICAIAGCGRPAELSRRGRCAQHSLPFGAARRERQLALARVGHRCVDCGAPAVEVDHRVACLDGGSDDAANLEPRCRPCHSRRHRLPHKRRPGVG
jgi:5-methylcytosine-specific restriction endonuclease McrA